MLRFCPPFFAVTIALVACAVANDAKRPKLSDLIDRLIDEQLVEESLSPSEAIDDFAFARRVTLDLAGRIPTLAELQEFANSQSSDKREAYVDSLLGSVDFAHHLRDTLDEMLLAPLKNDAAWREYLLEAALENRPWNRIFQEIILPDRECPADKRPAAFLQARAKELDSITNDVSVLLFGINIACAKCHDHPLVDDWQQRHYFGLASFFKRTYSTKGGYVAEKFDGRLKFTTTRGEEHEAEFMFLTGAAVAEPDPSHDAESLKEINQLIRNAERDENAPQPPQPEFSPRAELVRIALAPDSHHLLSRNIVNRTWARLIGRGIVHPLDQMHSENPPSHPALLDALAFDFTENAYDLKRLIRAIVLTRAYARSTHWKLGIEPPAPELFACGLVRPLTPRQLALSLHLATRNPILLSGLANPKQWSTERQELEQRSEAMSARFPIPTDGFQVATDEAMQFSNSKQFDDAFLGAGNDRLVGYLSSIQEVEQLVQTAFLTIVSRPPTDTELGAVALHIAQRPDRRIEAIEQVVWALLASPEMRFNH